MSTTGTALVRATQAMTAALTAQSSAASSAATATTQASTATSAATTATAAAALSAIVGVLGAPATALPYCVTAISGGVGTGTGGTNGTYALGVTGGPAGFAATVTIAGGAISGYTITNTGLATTNAAPTLSLAGVPGLTGATVPTATVGTIPVARTFWAPSTDGTQLLAWQNSAGALAAYGSPQFSNTLATGIATQIANATAREPAEVAALANTTAITGWQKLSYTESNNPANAPGTQGEQWGAFDAGTDLTVGAMIDAICAALSVASTATQIRARVWKVATTDANVESGPAQTNDVLISDVTLPMSGLEGMDAAAAGLTANTVERMVVLPVAAPFPVETGKTYKYSLSALDNTSTAVATSIGFRSITGNTRQRRVGGYRATVGAGSFTNHALTNLPSVGVLQRNLIAQAAILATPRPTRQRVWFKASRQFPMRLRTPLAPVPAMRCRAWAISPVR